MNRAPHHWTVINDTIVSFTMPGTVSDEDWIPFVEGVKRPGVNRYLGTAIGVVEVNSVQRNLMGNALYSRKIPVAAITDEALIRGIATAMSWIGVKIKAFPWSDLNKGIEYLGVKEPWAAQMAAYLNDLRKRYLKDPPKR